MKRFLPLIPIGAAIVIACFVANWPAVRFAKLQGGEFMSHLGVLLIFALLIERTVEVFLSIWRSEESYKLQAVVQRLIDGNTAPSDAALKKAQEDLIKYKTQTQRWALPSSFILGLLLASFGVRIIDQFVVIADVHAANALGESQLWWFHIADIVLTAALLAGGADPIHKLMDAFRKFMEASSARASGTLK